jgi:hypothetical protein
LSGGVQLNGDLQWALAGEKHVVQLGPAQLAALPTGTHAPRTSFSHTPPPPPPIRAAGLWAGWWSWCMGTPPRPVRAAREYGEGRLWQDGRAPVRPIACRSLYRSAKAVWSHEFSFACLFVRPRTTRTGWTSLSANEVGSLACVLLFVV